MAAQKYNSGDWRVAEDADVEKWANDPNCNQQKECAEELVRRGRPIGDQRLQIEKDRERLTAHPFDPRTEVSADARRIIKHLWILLFAIPLIVGVLWALLHDMR
jgi:hypothetical protein